MRVNMASWDRIVRVAMALGLGAWARNEYGALALVLWIVAAILFLTALLGRCGIYALFGIRTCPAPQETAKAK